MNQKLSIRISSHQDNEPLAPGVRDYWALRATHLELECEALLAELEMEKTILNLVDEEALQAAHKELELKNLEQERANIWPQ